MSDLAKALAKAQAEFPAIGRSKEVRVQTKTGGSYTFAYEPLDAILNTVRPVLAANGLAFSQLLGHVGGAPALKTMLMHEGGEVIQDSCPLPSNGSLTAQEFGSLVTYFRRYALVAVLGIATEEDDDGNHASGNQVSNEGQWEAVTPTEPIKPSDVVLHWSKNKGKKLSELTKKQLLWYAHEWKMQETPSDYDHLVKTAAIALANGDDSPINVDPFPDVPF